MAERVIGVVEALKDLATDATRPVVAIAASDRAGIAGEVRTRLARLRASSALAYEADAPLQLNDKFSIVSRAHLLSGGGTVDGIRDCLVCTVKKNPAGQSGLDLEVRAHLSRGHDDRNGGRVSEALVDDRIHRD